MMDRKADSLRVYVKVAAEFDSTGLLTPTSFVWEDGRRYEIDRVLNVQPSQAQKSGGQGDRYMIRVNNKVRALFFEHNARYGETVLGRWFIERK